MSHSQREVNSQVLVAFLFLAFCSITLRIRKFPTLYQIVSGWPTRRRFFSSRGFGMEEVRLAIHRASVWMPVPTLCLVHSAALVLLLRSHAVPAKLVIGIRRRPFRAHAWVESNGEVVGPRVDAELCTVVDRF